MNKFRPGTCSKCGDKDRITKNKLGTLYCVLCNKDRLDKIKSEKNIKMVVAQNDKGESQIKNKSYFKNTGRIVSKKEPSGEGEVFRSIWESREHVSFLSGKYLGDEANASFFSHILSKSQSKYPKFKLYEKNIVLLTSDEHYLLDFGTEKQRHDYAEENGCLWGKLYKLRDELKAEYLRL